MRIILLLVLLIIIAIIQIIIYMKTKSAYKKYDDILKNQENDVTIRKRFAHGEFDESIKILKKLQAERKLKSN